MHSWRALRSTRVPLRAWRKAARHERDFCASLELESVARRRPSSGGGDPENPLVAPP